MGKIGGQMQDTHDGGEKREDVRVWGVGSVDEGLAAPDQREGQSSDLQRQLKKASNETVRTTDTHQYSYTEAHCSHMNTHIHI